MKKSFLLINSVLVLTILLVIALIGIKVVKAQFPTGPSGPAGCWCEQITGSCGTTPISCPAGTVGTAVSRCHKVSYRKVCSPGAPNQVLNCPAASETWEDDFSGCRTVSGTISASGTCSGSSPAVNLTWNITGVSSCYVFREGRGSSIFSTSCNTSYTDKDSSLRLGTSYNYYVSDTSSGANRIASASAITPSSCGSPTPSNLPCQSSCTATSQCTQGLTCVEGKCVNNNCATDTDCVCGNVPSQTYSATLTGPVEVNVGQSFNLNWTCSSSIQGRNLTAVRMDASPAPSGWNRVMSTTANGVISTQINEPTDFHVYCFWGIDMAEARKSVGIIAAVNTPPTGSLTVNDCGLVTANVSDTNNTSGGNMTVRLYGRVEGSSTLRLITLSSPYSSGSIPANQSVTLSFDQNAFARSYGYGRTYLYLDTRDILPNGSAGSYVRVVGGSAADSYVINNPATYSGQCDVSYKLLVNDDDKTCQVVGSIVNPDGSCQLPGANNFVWKAPVREFMQDYGGDIKVKMVGNARSYANTDNDRCNVPETDDEQTFFEDTFTRECAIPDSIKITDLSNNEDVDGDKPVVIYSQPALGQPRYDDVLAEAQCTDGTLFNLDAANIIEGNSGKWEYGDLADCSYSSVDGSIPPFNIKRQSGFDIYRITAGDNATDCDGSVRAIIINYVLLDRGGSGELEFWGRLTGTKTVEVKAGDRVSEEFKYTGDVITNPPPGFDKFIEPYVGE
ncbi:MAG: hypothetical protein WC570_00935 [Patescibacteria group bacterium]